MAKKKSEFQAWREEMGFSLTEAAEALGISRSHVINLVAGENRNETGNKIELTRTQRLAMAAVAKRLKPWGEE